MVGQTVEQKATCLVMPYKSQYACVRRRRRIPPPGPSDVPTRRISLCHQTPNRQETSPHDWCLVSRRLANGSQKSPLMGPRVPPAYTGSDLLCSSLHARLRRVIPSVRGPVGTSRRRSARRTAHASGPLGEKRCFLHSVLLWIRLCRITRLAAAGALFADVKEKPCSLLVGG